MRGALQSRRIMMGKPSGHLRKGTLLAGAMVWPLVLVGAAFGQTDQFGLNEATPVDEDAGIRVPEGFDAKVFAEGVGRARHIAVRDNGDVFVALRLPMEGSGIVALRDDDGDGTADQTEYFGEHAGTGLAIHDGFLYASSDDAIYRYALPESSLVPAGAPEAVVEGFLAQRSHSSKAFAIDGSGDLYVNVGAPSNACRWTIGRRDRLASSLASSPVPCSRSTLGSGASMPTRADSRSRTANVLSPARATSWRSTGTRWPASCTS